MFRLKREQFQSMVAGSEAMLLAAIGNLVRQDHAYVVQGLPKDLFDDMIGNGLKAARIYGLTSPKDLANFVLLMFEVGPEFHRHPVIQQTLSDPSLAPEAKMDAMYERTPDEVWHAIDAVIDRQTWFPELRESSAD